MASKQLIDYIENGNIVNSVNYPNCAMPRTTETRLVILHKNINNMIAHISGTIGADGINIAHLANKSKGDYAVTIVDVDESVSEKAISHISAIDGIIRVRVIK